MACGSDSQRDSSGHEWQPTVSKRLPTLAYYSREGFWILFTMFCGATELQANTRWYLKHEGRAAPVDVKCSYSLVCCASCH